MLFIHENSYTVIDMNYVNTVERNHRNLIFHFDDGDTAFLECQTDGIAEELICLLTELSDKKGSFLWTHEYLHPQLGYTMEHLMEY